MRTSFFKSRKNVITFAISASLVVAILVTTLVLLLVKVPTPNYVSGQVGEFLVRYDEKGVDTALTIESYTGKCSTYQVVVPEKISIGDETYIVTKIADQAFSGIKNQNLKEAVSIELPETITEIGNKAFEETTKLKSLHFKGTILSYGEDLFLKSGVEDLTIDNLTAGYKYRTFINKKFTKLTINNIVGNLNDFKSTYSAAIKADTLILGKGVTNVQMFSITMQEVKTLSYYHTQSIFPQNFLSSSDITTVYINGVGSSLQSDTLSNIPTKAKESIENIYLDEKCDTLNDAVFAGFSALENVYINENIDVVTVRLDTFTDTNAKIVFEKNNDISLNIRRSKANADGDNIKSITSDFMARFSNVTAIKTVGIENGITRIEANAFSAATSVSVMKFEINSDITYIDETAFGNLTINFYGPTDGYVYSRLKEESTFKKNRLSYNNEK